MPRYYYGWNVVVAMIVVQALVYGVFMSSFGILLLPWSREFHVSRTQLTLIPLAFQIMSSIASPIVGQFIDRLPLRPLLLTGMVAAISGLVMTALATHFGLLMAISIAVVPLAMTFAGPFMGQVIAAKWFRERLGLAIALSAAGGSVGTLLMPPLMQYLIDLEGWRQAYLHIAIGAALIMTPLYFVVRDPPERIAAPADGSPAAAAPDRLRVMGVVVDRVFLLITLGLAMVAGIQLVFTYYLPAIARDAGIEGARAALLLSMIAGSTLMGKPAWGVLLDTLHPRYIYLIVGTLYLGAVGIMLGVAGSLSYPHMAAIAVAIGLGSGAIQALMTVVLTRRFGAAHIGKALGLGTPILSLCALGPLIVSYGYERTGSYGPGLMLLGGILLISMVTLFIGLRGLPRPRAAPAGDVAA